MEPPFPAYEGSDPYIFVCYSHSDADVVYPELVWLREQGINVWYDEGISPGAEFPEKLGRAILGADRLLFYVSERSVASRHCRDEVFFALDNDRPVLAVHLEPVEMPPGLALTTATTQAVVRHALSGDVYRSKLLEGIRSGESGDRPPAVSRRTTRRRALLVSVALLVVAGVAAFAGLGFMERAEQIRWAEQQGLPELDEMVRAEWRDFVEAYELAEEIEAVLPGDPRLEAVFEEISMSINVTSEPPGTVVSIKPYGKPDADWQVLGTTPLSGLRLPIGVLRWQFEAPGYATVQAAHSTWDLDLREKQIIVPNHLHRVLDPMGSAPDRTVRVTGAETPDGMVPDFYIDQFEVTNAEFQSFVDAGGYRRPEFWEHPFVDGDRELSFDEAMARFIDQTGRPGPSGWLGGTFESGKADHPVSGVSWFEAAAYARYRGRYLPSGFHWGLARGETSTLIQYPELGGHGLFTPFSNFSGHGTVPVGTMPGITSYGAYDMAGNVREWCFNPTSSGRLVRGGAYDDVTYKFEELSQAPPWFRDAGYGFRTVHLEGGRQPETVFSTSPITPVPEYGPEDVVSDQIFEVFLRQFDYDLMDSDAKLVGTTEGPFWRSERVSITLPYTDERMDVVVFLPENAEPPYQTVVYFPGSGSVFHGSSDDLHEYYEFPTFLSFLVRTGRAVVYPIYNGTFERAGELTRQLHLSRSTHTYTTYVVQLVQDFRRTVDYLNTREDIDAERIAYYGMSLGGILGPIMVAAEDRVAGAIFLAGGISSQGRPEAHPINYAPRVHVPVLILGGRYDSLLGYEQAIQPLHEFLGTPDEHKTLKLYDTDHIPPKKEFVNEILNWLDVYFGPVAHDGGSNTASAAEGL